MIVVDGNAGNEIGMSMRPGPDCNRGSAGDVLGFDMIAGTVLVFGECGIRPGAGMRRGTLGFVRSKPTAAASQLSLFDDIPAPDRVADALHFARKDFILMNPCQRPEFAALGRSFTPRPPLSRRFSVKIPCPAPSNTHFTTQVGN